MKQEISEGRITRPIRPAERNPDPIGTNLQTSWTGCSTTRRGFIDPLQGALLAANGTQ